jgi:hypothetical protein
MLMISPQSWTATNSSSVTAPVSNIHGDLGDLHAADAFVGEAFGFTFVTRLRAAFRDGHGAHRPARLFPGNFILGLVDLANGAADRFEVVRSCAEATGHSSAKRVKGFRRSEAGRGRDTSDGRAAAGPAGFRQRIFSDLYFDSIEWQAQRVGDDLGDDGCVCQCRDPANQSSLRPSRRD